MKIKLLSLGSVQESTDKSIKTAQGQLDGYTLLGACANLMNKLIESVKECDKRAKDADEKKAAKNKMFWIGAKTAYQNVINAINKEGLC